MGDNGAGKSTLAKLIAGNFQPSDGQIFLGGAETRFADSLDARDARHRGGLPGPRALRQSDCGGQRLSRP